MKCKPEYVETNHFRVEIFEIRNFSHALIPCRNFSKGTPMHFFTKIFHILIMPPLKFKCDKCGRDFDAKPKLNGHLSSCKRTRRKPIQRQFKRPKNFKNAPEAIVPKERSLQPAFAKYDRQLFYGRLSGHVMVAWHVFHGKWRDCLGLTHAASVNGKIPVRVQLNWKWLQDRSIEYVESVLVHEMIHAYLQVIGEDDEEEHGENFKREINRVNSCRLGIPVTINNAE